MAGNFPNVAVGEGYNHVYEFNFPLFCERFGLKPPVTRSALLLLTRAGYMEYIDEIATRSRVMIVADKQELYSVRVGSTADDVLQSLLRSYTGLFADYVTIDEHTVARQLMIGEDQVYQALLELQREHVLHYIPRRVTPYIFYPTSRELPRYVELGHEVYEAQRERMKRRIDAMKTFAYAQDRCRVAGMLAYFGEKNPEPCGTCDVCRASAPRRSRETDLKNRVFDAVKSRVTPTGIDELAEAMRPVSREAVVEALRGLIAEGKVTRVSSSEFI